jgi:hypothetical protein
MVETSVPLPTSRSYPVSKERAYPRWRLLQLFEHSSQSGMRTAPASPSADDPRTKLSAAKLTFETARRLGE